MKVIGLCTRFTPADEWAFDYAFKLVKAHGWQLNICHWLHSPYRLRREMVQADLFEPGELVTATPEVLNHLEYQLRQYFDERLGDFTNAAFKLCEGMYQVEMVRCFRQNLLDLVVMGYQEAAKISFSDETESGSLPLEEFIAGLHHPVILVGHQGPGTFLLNQKAVEWLEVLDIPEGQWTLVQPEAALAH
ncbi:MAG: hypothetical protein AB1894_29375 [Chloroflexota bacterium]